MAAALTNEDIEDNDNVIVPEVTAAELTSLLDIIYKGQMMIAPPSTWAVKNLVQTLQINAKNVSVLSNVKFPTLENKHGGSVMQSKSLFKEYSPHSCSTGATIGPLKRKRRSLGKLLPPKKQKLDASTSC